MKKQDMSDLTTDVLDADYIFARGESRVKCPFYFKIGACRHGVKCTKSHRAPRHGYTVLLKNFYLSPLNSSCTAVDVFDAPRQYTNEELQEHFEETYEEMFVELERKYGDVEELNVCDNLSEHLAGNVFVRFRYESDAERAVEDLNNRWFNGRPIYAELSHVTNFDEACCQFEPAQCSRGGFCNFLHLKEISDELSERLFNRSRISYRRSRSRTPSPWSNLARSRSRSRSRSTSKRKSSKSRRRHSRSRSRSRSRSQSRSKRHRHRRHRHSKKSRK